MNPNKKVLLAVSFGTSYAETRDKTIGAVEKDMAAAFPDWEVRRAFTSGMILNVLKKRDGLHIDNVEEAMERLIKDGVTTLLVQPTHVINGEEYEKILEQIAPYRRHFDRLSVGRPLLTASEDFDKTVEAVMQGWAESRKQEAGEALVLMGHGTGHHADAAYAALDYRFKERGYSNVFVGTVEGYPSLEQVMAQMEKRRKIDKQEGKETDKQDGGIDIKKVILMPFMLVAGDHATNDMAGDEPDSWKNQLEEQGYRVECALKGLGEFQAIRDIYLEHAGKALDE